MWTTSKSPSLIVEEKGFAQVSDANELEKMIDTILLKNPTQVIDYKAGKTKLFGFFVGAVMKESKGQANPDIVNEILKRKLDPS